MAANAQAVSWPGTRAETTPFSSGIPLTGPSRAGEGIGFLNHERGIPKNRKAAGDQSLLWTSSSWEWLVIDSSFTILPESRKLK